MGVLDFLTASAVSTTVSGNTGINPIFTLFLVGVIEKSDPDLLSMDGTIEKLLSSWPALIILGILSILEFVGMCIPVVDEAIDTAMTFVVPIVSVLGSLSTFGLFNVVSEDADQENRMLEGSSGLLIFYQVFLACFGIGLALCLHLVKMLVRLVGEGWLTGCITILEVTWTASVITFIVFVKPIAIVVACCFIFAAAVMIKRLFVDKKNPREELALARKSKAEEAELENTTPDSENKTEVAEPWGITHEQP